jgi:hypothetical protein
LSSTDPLGLEARRVMLRFDTIEVVGWTLNVSRGGTRIALEHGIGHVRQGLECEIEGADVGKHRARIVWIRSETNGYTAGIQYLDTIGSVPPPESGRLARS